MSGIGPAARARVEAALAGAGVPGIGLAVAAGDGAPAMLCLGVDADGRPLEPDSLFPVASVTKLATALCLLRLHDLGRLDLDAPVAASLPDAACAAGGATLADLLCHVGGLPVDLSGGLAPYQAGLDWPTLTRACLATAPATPPRARVQYSNVGYGLLAIAAERAAGRPFVALLDELVLGPLGVEGYLGVGALPRPPALVRDVRGPAAGGELEPFNSAFWRRLAMPWAGLVTTAEGALRLVAAFAGDLLRPATRARATSDQTGGLGGGLGGRLLWEPSPWGLGPELRGRKAPHWAPPEASPGSFGHAGASGCLAWRDPERDLSWALIGTRTADSGWLLRHGSAIGAALLDEAD